MVAAVCSWHEHHSQAAAEIDRRLDRGEQLCTPAPALVEAYAVLTRLPPPHRLSAADAWALVEGNFVTPNLLGATMTVNPFLIFLSLTFWLWAWGPIGGLIAVPSLLVILSVITNILPIRQLPPREERRLLAQKATRDVAKAEPMSAPPKPPKSVAEPARKRPAARSGTATAN